MEQTDQPGPNVLRSAVVAVRLKVEVSLSSSFRNNDGGQMFVSSTHFLDMAGPTPLKFPFLVWQKASDIRYRKIGPFSQDFLLKRMGWSWSERQINPSQSASERILMVRNQLPPGITLKVFCKAVKKSSLIFICPWKGGLHRTFPATPVHLHFFGVST